MNESENILQQELPDLVEVVGIRFKVGGRIYYFDPIGMPFNNGEDVIIDTAMGYEYGECAQGNHMVEASRVVQPLRPVVRRATAEDAETLAANYEKEKQAFKICQEKIAEHELDMKLVGVEYSFDGSKILFFFTSDGRVDFRELVKNLASVFRTRIELRQIGVRDEAKLFGGLGICGRQFCCSSFLDDFHPVSIKMAKTQNLSLNPVKISGACGRLMCCLKYEQYAYEDMHKRTPKVESLVQTDKGQGVITEVNLLKASVKIRLDDEPETLKTYNIRDITVLRNGGKNKKETPLLPPDPPILEDEPVEEVTVFNYEAANTDISVDEKEALKGRKKRDTRNKNRNKKISSESEPKQEQSVSQHKANQTQSSIKQPNDQSQAATDQAKQQKPNNQRKGRTRTQKQRRSGNAQTAQPARPTQSAPVNQGVKKTPETFKKPTQKEQP